MPGFELIGKEEKEAVDQLFEESGILFRHGFEKKRKHFHVLELQKQFAQFLGTKYALATTSGTSALKVALKAMGVGPGDEVITSCFTFVATVEAILDCGAKPVVVNIDETLGIDPGEIEKHITKKTKVIIPVHMLGVAAQMDSIIKIARTHQIQVLEDNAEALGAFWGKKRLGTTGDASITSLDFGKLITSGEGGIIFTDDKKLFKLACEYHDHGHMNNPKLPRGKDTHRIYGFNFRMTEVQAVIAREQLKKFPGILLTNKRNYEFLQRSLKNIPGIAFREIPAQCTPSYDTLIFHLPTKEQADKFADLMSRESLGTKNIPSAMEWHFAGFWDHIFKDLGVSKKELWKMFLPSYHFLSRSITLPINVKTSQEELKEQTRVLAQIAKEVLTN